MFSFIMPKKVALNGVCLVLFYYKTLTFFSKIKKLNVTKRSQTSLTLSVVLFVLFMVVSRKVSIKMRIMKNKKGSKCFAKQDFLSLISLSLHSCLLFVTF